MVMDAEVMSDNDINDNNNNNVNNKDGDDNRTFSELNQQIMQKK